MIRLPAEVGFVARHEDRWISPHEPSPDWRMVRRALVAAERDGDGARLTVRLMAGGLRWFPIVPTWSTGAFQNLTLLDSFLSLDGAESRADFRFSVGKASELDELRSMCSSGN